LSSTNSRSFNFLPWPKPANIARAAPGYGNGAAIGRPDQDRFPVRGYIEEGTTTTPFDMVVLNKMSRVHLCMDVIRYVPKAVEKAQSLLNFANDALLEHRRYITEYFDDVPRVRDWVWTD
jgi:xylulose-5-phosphate/fructose-6-phosphate phosphoketolase